MHRQRLSKASLAITGSLLLTAWAIDTHATPPEVTRELAALKTQKWRVGAGERKNTVIFLHGLGDQPNTSMVCRLVKELNAVGGCMEVRAPWLRPVRLDENGHVRSAGPHTMSDQLQRARREIEQAPDPVVLIGHSFGGKAAIQLAKEFPGKVRCVVGLAPSVKMLYSYWKGLTQERGLADKQTVKGRLGAYERQLRAALALAKRERRVAPGVQGKLGNLLLMQDLAEHDEPAMERNVRTPMLVFHGTDDRAVSIHYIRRFRDDNPDSVKLVEYEGLDHFLEKPLPLDERNENGPVVDAQATKHATRQIAREISNFIQTHANR